jgi:hypothetical protein
MLGREIIPILEGSETESPSDLAWIVSYHEIHAQHCKTILSDNSRALSSLLHFSESDTP